jgi:hypothetical protein
MAPRIAWPGVALLASMLVATVASAAPTAADRETARTLMDQGRDLRDKGDLQEALKRFKAADDIMHVPTTALALAKTQAALGLLVEARDTLAASRRIPEKPTDPQPFKVARAEADRLDTTLAGRVPALTITVQGATPSDRLTLAVDGVPVPAAMSGLPLSVDPGHHVVVAKTAGGEGHQEVDVKEGEQKPVGVTLVATAAPPPPEEPAKPPPTETPPAPVRSHSPTVVTWVGIGVGVAGVAMGTITGVLSMSKKSTLQSECTKDVCTSPSADSDLSSANTLATLSDVGFAVAGAGAVVAIISLVVGHQANDATPAEPPATDTSLRVIPWFGGNAVGLRGTF